MTSQDTVMAPAKHSGLSTPQRAQDRWLAVARLGWFAVTILTLGLFFAGISGRFDQLLRTADERSLLELGLPVSAYAGYVIALNLIVVLVHHAIAAVIFWYRSDDWLALLVSYALVTNGAITPLALMYPPGSVLPVWRFLIVAVIYIGLVSGVTLPYLFPNGRFVPPWTRLLAITWAVLILFAIFLPNSAVSLSTWPLLFQLLALLIWSGAGGFAQIYRYLNISDPIQRQQTKWALLGLAAAVFGPFAYFLPFVILPSISGPIVPNILYQRVGASFFTFSLLIQLGTLTLTTMVLLLFPLSFAIAILRYRLWDIDILINRTLVYGLLTGLLALVYVSSVVLLQSLFRALIGQETQLTIIVSTLAIAALFNPLRRRVQTFIDRRYYRYKYDAAQTLAAFNATVRDEVDLDKLTAALLSVVEETMQPAHVSVWLRPPDPKRKM